MEQKNRLVIVVAIVALIVAAICASFGRVLFAANTPEVILPSSSADPGDISAAGSEEQDFQRVEVTTQTVTGVVATLERPLQQGAQRPPLLLTPELLRGCIACAKVPGDSVGNAAARLAIPIGIDSMGHFIVFGLIRQQMSGHLENRLCLHTSQHSRSNPPFLQRGSG